MPRSAPTRPLDFEALHSRYFDDVSGYIARRIGDDELARDLAQEAFLRAYRARGSYDPRRPIWPWLSRIARNLVVNAVRDEGRRRSRLEPFDDEKLASAGSEGDPEAAYVNGHLRRTIQLALGELSPRSRRILLLRSSGGLSHREIAEAERMTEDAVKAQLKRGRQTFRTAFKRLSDETRSLAVLPFLRRLRLRFRTDHLGLLPNVSLASLAPIVGTAVIATVLIAGGWQGPGRHGNARTAARSVVLRRESGTSPRGDPQTVGRVAGSTHVSSIGIGAGAPASATVTTDRRSPAQRTVTVRRHNPDGRGSLTTVQLPCTGDAPLCTAIDTLTNP